MLGDSNSSYPIELLFSRPSKHSKQLIPIGLFVSHRLVHDAVRLELPSHCRGGLIDPQIGIGGVSSGQCRRPEPIRVDRSSDIDRRPDLEEGVDFLVNLLMSKGCLLERG